MTEIFALGVECSAHEIGHRHARDFERGLKRHKNAFVAAILGLELQEVLTVEDHFAFGHLIFGIAHQDVGERRFARAVGAHEHVHFAIANGEIDAAKYFFAFDGGVEVAYF